MALPPRSNLGPYEIVAPLGAGGMGEVYLARDPVLGRKVALKLIAGREIIDPASLGRLAHEARAASALNHPNIVTIYEVALESTPPYIAMEFVEGRDLRDVIREGSPSVRKILDIASQIADGLAAAHEKGIVHRDLKPENVMVTKEGLVKVLDFGLAKNTVSAGDDTDTMEMAKPETRPGTILGTVGYMSPEQALGEEVDYRSDQFSFGAILYELATGKRAFLGANVIDTLSKILHEDPEPVAMYNAKAPAPLRWIIERCLAKARDERYTSTRDLARELRTVRDRLSETTVSSEVIAASESWRHRVTRIAMLSVGGAAIAVALFLGAQRWISQQRARPAASASVRTLSVIPFRDAGGASTPLVDGLRETVSARLSRISSLQIFPATADDSAAKSADLQLRGTVQRERNRIRIAWSIISRDGAQVAGDTYDADDADLFVVEDQLAASIAHALQLEAPGVARQGELDRAAQDHYLQAVGYLTRYENPASVEAAIMLLEALSATSRSAIVEAALGRAYLYKYRLTSDHAWAEKAIAACDRARALDPNDLETDRTRADVLRETGKGREAVDVYRRITARMPTDADAMTGLAEAEAMIGDDKRADADFRRAIQLRPTYWGGYNRYGAFLLTGGRSEEAAAMFRKVTELTPDNVRGWGNLGAAYQRLGKPDKAIEAYRHSLDISPNSDTLSNLGTCLFFLGRYGEAGDAFQRAAALTPRDPVVWANLGDAWRWTPGRERDAASAYERAIALSGEMLRVNPGNGFMRSVLAASLARRGRFEEASREIRRAVATTPGDVTCLYQAAIVANLQGHTDEAVSWLAKAVGQGYAPGELARDPELANLRELPSFHTLVHNKPPA